MELKERGNYDVVVKVRGSEDSGEGNGEREMSANRAGCLKGLLRGTGLVACVHLVQHALLVAGHADLVQHALLVVKRVVLVQPALLVVGRVVPEVVLASG